MAVYNMTKRKIAAQETKRKIYKSAMKLFQQNGYDNVTVEDITQKANVAKGTFYTYFKSKDAVLVRTFEEIDKHYKEAFETLDNNASAEQQFMTLGRAMCRYVEESFGVNYTKVVYQNQIGLSKRPMILNNKDRYFYVILRQIVEKGKQTGEFRTDISDEDMVLLFARLLHGLMYDWCMYDGKFDLLQEGELYFERILSMVRIDAGGK